MTAIKGIVLDIDGVIIGKKKGFNFPMPNEKVINKLKEVSEQGISVSLCSSKPFFAMSEVVEKIGLNSFHIASGGAIIGNTVDGRVISKHLIDKTIAKKLIDFAVKNDIYIEAYTEDGYYIYRNEICDITKKRAERVIMREATVVEDLNQIIDKDVIQFKFTTTEENKEKVNNLFENENIPLSLNWTFHPAILPFQVGDITSKGISKKQGIIDLAIYLGISTDNMLGVGDSNNDWNFMQLCKYTSAMGNATEELKKLVLSKGGYIGKSVDDNGIIDILDYFI